MEITSSGCFHPTEEKMKKETKGKLLALGVTLLVVAFFTIIYLDTNNEVTFKNDYCESKGYEGYKDEYSIIVSGSSYRCYKKVFSVVGYEYEYSGIVEFK